MLEKFSKMKLVKTFLTNSMISERQSNIALLSIERVRADCAIASSDL